MAAHELQVSALSAICGNVSKAYPGAGFEDLRGQCNAMRVTCFIQARDGSKRLPKKIYADIGGRPMMWHVQQRANEVGIASGLIFPEDFGCDENDVLARYYLAAKGNALDAVMRVTGDCPLLDPNACQRVLQAFQTGLYDYVANDIYKTYPDGLGCEVFSFAALEYAHQNATKPYDREHVTPFLKSHKEITKLNLRCPINGLSDLKLSVDTQEDLDFVRAIDAAQPKDYSLQSTLDAIGRLQGHIKIEGIKNGV
jgi:spore coat polysaccharide biosynthesis protein SpsF (cytidylyltransferase family)